MKTNKLLIVKFFAVIIILLLLNLTGCLEQSEKKSVEKLDLSEQKFDEEPKTPQWRDGIYHDYQATTQMLKDFNRDYPDLVDIFSIGKSVLNRDIWCIRITNEKNNAKKYSCVIDGCIHGNEWEAGEICLYFSEYLLINYDENKTITDIINKSEIYIIPLLNPDGREKDERYNENGIDLNRNFDVHFGRIRGGSFPLGKLFGFIKIPMINIPFLRVYTNAGKKAFSESETVAFRNFMKSLDSDKLSFYVGCHTAVHIFVSIVNVNYKPEFTFTTKEQDVINNALNWVKKNTQYDILPVDNYSFVGAGFAHHWVFKEFRILSFSLELLSQDYAAGYKGGGPHDDLVYWMQESFPVLMYLLVNIENFNRWETPDVQPALPEGIPLSLN